MKVKRRTRRLDDGVSPQAQNFKHTSQKVARAYWWKNVKLIVVMVVIVAIIVLIIVLLATGVIPTNGQSTSPTTKPPK